MQGHASSEDGKIEDAARDEKEEIKRLAVDDVRRRMQTVATHYLEDCRLYFCQDRTIGASSRRDGGNSGSDDGVGVGWAHV